MRIAASPVQQSVVESSGDLVAWRWRSGVQFEWVGRQDMEPDGTGRADIVHLAMIWEARSAVIASEAKQSTPRRTQKHGLLRRFSAKLLCNFVASSLAQTLRVCRRQ
jgi:hypothetical protein